MFHRSLALPFAALWLFAYPAGVLGQELVAQTHELTSEAAKRMVEVCDAFGEQEGSALAVAVTVAAEKEH